MKTHQQALDIAGDYDNLSDKIQAYLKERGLVAVPLVATVEMEIAGTEQWLCVAATEERSAANWDAMLAAAPNPFEGEE